MVERRNWTREEVIDALSLYVQIPFGTIHERNPLIRALAARLGRTPGSISYKLGNLASLDPELAARGIRGIPNRSALDKQVWEEFYGRWDLLAARIEIDDEQPDEVRLRVPTVEATEVAGTVMQRRGQSFFRHAVLAAYESRCCVTGIAAPALLRASHIVPWALSPERRLDPRNGLCLNALHDAAFDRGLMTVDESGCVLYAGSLWQADHSDEAVALLRMFDRAKIRDPQRLQPDSTYLAYHREHVFAA